MTTEQTEKLIYILREAKQIVNRSISDLCELSEQALIVLSENQKVPDTHVYSNDKHLDNKQQLAKRLGISQRTISELLNEGLPFVPFGTRKQFDYEEVIEWAKSKRIDFPNIKNKSETKLRVVK